MVGCDLSSTPSLCSWSYCHPYYLQEITARSEFSGAENWTMVWLEQQCVLESISLLMTVRVIMILWYLTFGIRSNWAMSYLGNRHPAYVWLQSPSHWVGLQVPGTSQPWLITVHFRGSQFEPGLICKAPNLEKEKPGDSTPTWFAHHGQVDRTMVNFCFLWRQVHTGLCP